MISWTSITVDHLKIRFGILSVRFSKNWTDKVRQAYLIASFRCCTVSYCFPSSYTFRTIMLQTCSAVFRVEEMTGQAFSPGYPLFSCWHVRKRYLVEISTGYCFICLSEFSNDSLWHGCIYQSGFFLFLTCLLPCFSVHTPLTRVLVCGVWWHNLLTSFPQLPSSGP